MQLKKTPEPFSPAFGEILYALSVDEEEKGAEISIFNSEVTEKIGIKKVTDAPEFTINVSDYVRSQINIEPFPIQECGLIEPEERTYYSCIAYQDWASTNPHTPGIVPVGMNQPLCEQIRRTLGGNEQDEICWVAGEGNVFVRALFPVPYNDPVEIHLGRAEISTPKILALILNSNHLDKLLQQRGMKWEYFTSFTVEIHAGYQSMATFEYRIQAHNCNKKRFAWWNRYGGIDFYSFEACLQEETLVSKQQIQAGERKLNLSAKSRKSGTVATACMTRKQCEWLSGISAAPQVWVEENNEFVPVDITDLRIPVYHPEKTEVEIHYEYNRYTEFQSF